MNLTPQIEPTSTDRLLTCLGLAIDEAKLVRSIITSKSMASKLQSENPLSRRLIQVNDEIIYLESKLAQLYSLSNRD
jgi:hypothetical protein